MSSRGHRLSFTRSRTLLGVGLMVFAMLIVPLADGLAKYLSASHSPVFLSWARYAAGTVFVLPVLIFARGGLRLTPAQLPSQILRTVFLAAAMTLYFMAIARVPLADALGAYFVAPIVATVLAVLVLRERLTRRKAVAVGLGFVGALLVVRPSGVMDVGMAYALAAGLLMAGYLVATRMAATTSSPFVTLLIQYLLGTLLLTPFAVVAWRTPAAEALWLILGMGLFSAVSHLASIYAFRFAQASTLSPLVYVELISATIFGFLVFGDFPSVLTWAGIAVIVLGGLSLIERR